jgi:hypothetical protein
MKYGVTSSKKTKGGKNPGLSKRAASQIRKMNAIGLQAKATERKFSDRRKALDWEATKITTGKRRGLPLPGNRRIPRI